MKNLSLWLLLSAFALTPVRVNAMMEPSRLGEEKESGAREPQQEVLKYIKETRDEAAIEESKEQGNPNFKPEGFIERGSEKSESKSIEAAPKNELSPLEQSAWETLQPAALAAHDAFEKLLGLPRDEEGNIDPSQQKELRTKILGLLKDYEKERQAWISQSTSQRLAEIATLEEATKPITFTIVSKLDVSTEKDRAVFWTGYTLENKRVAMEYAKEQGKKTIEMTHDGKLLDQLGMYKPDSPIAAAETDVKGEIKYKSKLGDLLFDAVSIQFAQGAFGKVTAVIYQPRTADEQAAYEKSAYARLEEPLLKAREQAGEPVELGKGRVEVPVEITLPALQALIKENAHKTEGYHFLEDFARHMASGKLSTETMEMITCILNDPTKYKEFKKDKESEELQKKWELYKEAAPLRREEDLAREKTALQELNNPVAPRPSAQKEEELAQQAEELEIRKKPEQKAKESELTTEHVTQLEETLKQTKPRDSSIGRKKALSLRKVLALVIMSLGIVNSPILDPVYPNSYPYFNFLSEYQRGIEPLQAKRNFSDFLIARKENEITPVPPDRNNRGRESSKPSLMAAAGCTVVGIYAISKWQESVAKKEAAKKKEEAAVKKNIEADIEKAREKANTAKIKAHEAYKSSGNKEATLETINHAIEKSKNLINTFDDGLAKWSQNGWETEEKGWEKSKKDWETNRIPELERWYEEVIKSKTEPPSTIRTQNNSALNQIGEATQNFVDTLNSWFPIDAADIVTFSVPTIIGFAIGGPIIIPIGAGIGMTAGIFKKFMTDDTPTGSLP